MAEIDFTKLPFDEAVALAMKEFDLGEEEATEFINLIHGKDVDNMNVSTKAKESKKLPKGTFTKIRTEVAAKAEDPNALAAWIKNYKKTGTMKKKEVTMKAGNSAGAKKGWLSRARGGVGKFAKKHAGKLVFAAGALHGAAAAHSFSGKTDPGRPSSGKHFVGSMAGMGAGSIIASKLISHAARGMKKPQARKLGSSLGKKFVAGSLTGAAARVAIPRIVSGIKRNRGRKAAAVSQFSNMVRYGKKVKEVTSRALTEKEKSLMAKVDSIRNLIGESLGKDYYVADLYDNHAIVTAFNDNKYYKVPYMETKDGVTAASKEQWTEVERSWEEVESKESSLVITKDANDKWRWTLFSTNAFEDNDKEVVSHKALLDDLEKSEVFYKENNNYGPLRWWHVVLGEDPVKDGLDIGTCDFRGMEDKIMVESGTFINEELGGALAPHAKELGGSIGFMHSTSEPDSDKVFHSIRIFERSLLPRERASNPLAQLIIQKEGGIMVKEKLEKLAQLLGGPDKAEQILGTAKEAQAAAEAEGVRTKETKVVTTKDEGGVDASDEVTQEEWDGFKEAVGAALEELMKNEGEAEGEEAESKEYKEFVAAFKELGKGQDKVVEVLEAMDTRLKALEGEQPRGTKYEASTDKSTIAEKGKHDEPKPDPMGSFVDGFVLRK